MGRAVQELRIDPSQGPRFSRRGVFEATARIIGGAAAARVIDVFDPLLAKTSLAAPLNAEFDIRPREGILGGHFFDQTKGDNAPENYGYAVLDTTDVRMWSEFQNQGGVDTWGFPVSQAWVDENGRYCQAFQKGVFQITADLQGRTQKLEWMNIFDLLADHGIDLDNPKDITPSTTAVIDIQANFGHDANGRPHPGSQEEWYQRRVLLEQAAAYPELKEAFLSILDRWNRLGLPIGFKDYGDVAVVRFQRSVFQLWKNGTSWTNDQPMTVVVANGGDVLKEKVLEHHLSQIAPEDTFLPVSGNLYGIGGGAEPPRPIQSEDPNMRRMEEFLARTNIVDSIQYRDPKDGKVYTVDSRITPSALFQITIPDELKQAVGEKMVQEKHTGMDSVTFVVARNDRELPEGVQMLEFGPDKIWHGKMGWSRIGNKGFIFLVPKDALNLNDPKISDGDIVNEPIPGFPLQGDQERRFGGLNQWLTSNFSRFIISGYSGNANVLAGNSEYIYFTQVQRPFKLSRR